MGVVHVIIGERKELWLALAALMIGAGNSGQGSTLTIIRPGVVNGNGTGWVQHRLGIFERIVIFWMVVGICVGVQKSGIRSLSVRGGGVRMCLSQSDGSHWDSGVSVVTDWAGIAPRWRGNGRSGCCGRSQPRLTANFCSLVLEPDLYILFIREFREEQ